MAYFAGMKKQAGPLGVSYSVNRYFLKGLSERNSQALSDHPYMATPPLEGMLSLRSQLLLLDVPQALEPVKDSLVQA